MLLADARRARRPRRPRPWSSSARASSAAARSVPAPDAQRREPLVRRAQARSAAAASPSSSSTMPACTSISSSSRPSPSSSNVARQASSIVRAASARPRIASSTAWQLSAAASTVAVAGRHPQDADDVEAAPAGARTTGDGPQSAASGAPASTALTRRAVTRAARRGQRAVERRLRGADLPELRQRARLHMTGLRDARLVAQRGELLGGGGHRVHRRVQVGAVGQVGELGRVDRRQGLQPRVAYDRGRELPDDRRGRVRVPRREQRLGEIEKHSGALLIVLVQAVQRASAADWRRPGDPREPARGDLPRRAARRRALPAPRPRSSSGPSCPRYSCACSRWKPMTSSCSPARSPALASSHSAKRSCSSRAPPSAATGRPRRGSARGGSERPARRSSTCPRAGPAPCGAASRGDRRCARPTGYEQRSATAPR